MRDSSDLIELTLEQAVAAAAAAPCPPRLAAALRHAVFPGGKRLRPALCLAVSEAAGGAAPELALAAGAAIELLHCASLVHDDLPCFDDAAVRRGQPSVHRAFGEPIAVLAGDALIVRAFELVSAAPGSAHQVRDVLAQIARGAGAPRGIAAGQAWEAEHAIDLAAYHRGKTGGLFAAACAAGAIAGGARSAEAWAELGARIGHAYQIADDLLDALGDARTAGKPVGRDAALGRPSAVRAGTRAAERALAEAIDAVLGAVPDCPGKAGLSWWLSRFAAAPGSAVAAEARSASWGGLSSH